MSILGMCGRTGRSWGNASPHTSYEAENNSNKVERWDQDHLLHHRGFTVRLYHCLTVIVGKLLNMSQLSFNHL